MRLNVLMALLLVGPVQAATDALIQPSPEVVAQARVLVDGMKRNERGPYRRLRWFCNDGSSHPPTPYPCAERGGGRQHAEYSDERQRLAQLGWHVGTVVAALRWEELWQPSERHQRLRELPLERYMEAVDDDWVLRRGRHYRGRLQLEDEEMAGRALLLRLIEQPTFLADNFLLMRELARTMPHGTPGTDRTRDIRHLAQEIAESESSFSSLRIEIHSSPSATTAKRVRLWLGSRGAGLVSDDLREKVSRLVTGLDELYGLAGRKLRLQLAADALSKHSPQATQLIREAQKNTGEARIVRLSQAMVLLRQDASSKMPSASLRRLDLLTELEAELRTSSLEYLAKPLDRKERLRLAGQLLRAAWGLGLLSVGERDALLEPIERLLESQSVSADRYAFVTRRLSLSAAWAAQTVRYTFAEPLLRYAALDAKAARFIDDLLRDSVLLPLGQLAHQLSLDGATVVGLQHQMFGGQASGLLGINPGVARGRLRVLDAAQLAQGVQAAENEIVVLTETLADLNPVAGILSLGEGNPLSHVQMLARNLGIPNVAIQAEHLSALKVHEGERVLLAVAGDGRVLLERDDVVPVTNAPHPESPNRAQTVSAPQPDLSVRQPLPLSALKVALSGKLVGPKAANVGELNRLFPGRIAPAIALPFGIFAEHTIEPRQRLHQAFEARRTGVLDQAGLDAELEAVRKAVSELMLKPELAASLKTLLGETFGQNDSYGLFVRSDTNAEDLPAFTGAGLNLTIPNVVGLDNQLAAVVKVWASVYTQRAMAWRTRILSNPEAIFASVLLMKSVPSEKSGVLVTTDLLSGREGLTVSVAWGVGGAVDGESAASSVLRPDGSHVLLAEAKAPYRRMLAAEGGVVWQPAPAGPLLDQAEMQALRTLANEVMDRYPPAFDNAGKALPWDIEFAFADGKLWLLQIRPLVQRGSVEADAVVNRYIPVKAEANQVSLDHVVDGQGGG